MNMLFRIFDTINAIVIICRCIIVCLVLSVFNYTAFYILPLAIVVDWLAFQISYVYILNRQLYSLNNIVDNLKEKNIEWEIIEDDIIKKIDVETKKYGLFKLGNKNGEKRIVVIRVNKLSGQFKSFPMYNATSFIFVPKTFYPQHFKDRTLLAHEFAHCVSHDLMLVFRKHLCFSIIVLVLLIWISNIYIWTKIVVVLFALVLLSLQCWHIPYNEIMANNYALEVINTLYGKNAMKESAEYLLKVRTEYSKERVCTFARIVEKLQVEFLQKCVAEGYLIQHSSPMNLWLSTMYYTLFITAGYGIVLTSVDMSFSWYILIVTTIIGIVAYCVLKILITNIWIKKIRIYRKIGI